MFASGRWSLTEYGQAKNIVGPISEKLKLERVRVRDFFLSAGHRAKDALKFSDIPLSIIGDSVRAVNMAGLLRVAPGIEIEIAPKFLGLDSDNPRWREDFFFLATLSHHGRLLNSDKLKAKTGDRGDLHILVARALIEMFKSNERRPLRTYRKKIDFDFSFDGDVDPESIILPEPDGFEQTSIVYSRQNAYNSTILAATREILPSLRDPGIIAQLERMVQALSPQKNGNSTARHSKLPSRARRWQSLHDLSVDVLNGFGLSFSTGSARAPGYIFDTWRVWEDTLNISLRIGFKNANVKTQDPSVLGKRFRVIDNVKLSPSNASVIPDIKIVGNDQTIPRFLVDAKYKGRIEKGRTRITEADLYESLAFSKATKCEVVVLAYPAIPVDRKRTLGSVETFEIIEVDNVFILGVEIETRGISSTGGLSRFSNKCAACLEELVVKTKKSST